MKPFNIWKFVFAIWASDYEKSIFDSDVVRFLRDTQNVDIISQISIYDIVSCVSTKSIVLIIASEIDRRPLILVYAAILNDTLVTN